MPQKAGCAGGNKVSDCCNSPTHKVQRPALSEPVGFSVVISLFSLLKLSTGEVHCVE